MVNEVHLVEEHKESINGLHALDFKYNSKNFFLLVLLLHYCKVAFVILVIQTPCKESESHLVCIQFLSTSNSALVNFSSLKYWH